MFKAPVASFVAGMFETVPFHSGGQRGEGAAPCS